MPWSPIILTFHWWTHDSPQDGSICGVTNSELQLPWGLSRNRNGSICAVTNSELQLPRGLSWFLMAVYACFSFSREWKEFNQSLSSCKTPLDPKITACSFYWQGVIRSLLLRGGERLSVHLGTMAGRCSLMEKYSSTFSNAYHLEKKVQYAHW